MTRLLLLLPTVLGLLLLEPARGQDRESPPYKELSQLIHKVIVTQMPRSHEQKIGWDQTTPVPPGKLPLPRLRPRIKVGDREELAHGAWKRYKVWVEDPAKDLVIEVKDLKAQENGNWRLQLESRVLVHLEGEFRQYQKGLLLVGIQANADAVLWSCLDFDIAVELNTSKLPPEVKVKPKVVGTKLDILDFRLGRIGRVEIIDESRRLDNELRHFLRDLLKTQEPAVQEYANQAIARALEQGKGTVSAAELLKVLGKKGK